MCLCWCFICGSSSYSHSLRIFYPANFFVSKVFKAPCMVTKARSTEDNEGNGDGMLSPSGQECVPLPRSQSSIHCGPPAEKKKALPTYQVTLCASRSLYQPSRVCLSSDPGGSGTQNRTGVRERDPFVPLKSNDLHPFHLQNSLVHGNYI